MHVALHSNKHFQQTHFLLRATHDLPIIHKLVLVGWGASPIKLVFEHLIQQQ